MGNKLALLESTLLPPTRQRAARRQYTVDPPAVVPAPWLFFALFLFLLLLWCAAVLNGGLKSGMLNMWLSTLKSSYKPVFAKELNFHDGGAIERGIPYQTLPFGRGILRAFCDNNSEWSVTHAVPVHRFCLLLVMGALE